MKWIQCVVPKESKEDQWITKERNALLRYSDQLIRCYEQKNWIFLVALFSDKNLAEMAIFFMGKLVVLFC